MSFCYICHRELGDSYDLMWAGGYTNKLVPVCSEDRECRSIRKRAALTDGPKAEQFKSCAKYSTKGEIEQCVKQN